MDEVVIVRICVRTLGTKYKLDKLKFKKEIRRNFFRNRVITELSKWPENVIAAKELTAVNRN